MNSKYIVLCFSILLGIFSYISYVSAATSTPLPVSLLSENWTFAVQSASGVKDEIDGVSLDSEGNTVIGGLFSGKVKFGEEYKTAKKGSDMFIEKLDTTGKRVWFQQIDSGTNDFLWDLEIDSTGDVVISGGYGGTITFQSTYYTTFGPEEFKAYRDGSAFYAKLDGKNGNIKWIQTAGVPMKKEQILSNSETVAGGNEIKIDSKNNIIATMMGSGATYEIGANTYKKQGHKDAFIMKLDPNGKFVWSYQFLGDGSKQIRALALTGKDEIAFGHEYIGTILGVKGEKFSTPGKNYPFGTFGMLSSTGGLLWMKGVESSDYSNIRGAGGDSLGNVYYTGQVQDKAKVDKVSITTTKSSSVLVMKYDRMGKKLWIRVLGNDGSDGAGELAVSKDKTSIAISSSHSLPSLNLTDETGKILQSKLHSFSTTQTSGALSIFDLSGNIVALTSPTQSEQSTGGVVDGGDEGCFVYQMAYRGKLSFATGDTYSTAGSKDKDVMIASVCPTKQKSLTELESIYGDLYMDLSGKKGLLLCFHGHGGFADSWGIKEQNKAYLENMKKEGYSYICPTSLDRKDKQWSPVNTLKNPDVLNVDALLKELNISSTLPVFLVGHSNGGGFIGRYALLSERIQQIAALQYVSSSGLAPAISYKDYTFPSAFMYSRCDATVPYADVEKNISLARSELGEQKVFYQKLDTDYQSYNKKENCHEFLDTSKYIIPFFEKYLQK